MNNALMLAWMVFFDAALMFYLIALIKSFSKTYKRKHAHYFIALDTQGGWRATFRRSERVKVPGMVGLVWFVSRRSRVWRILMLVWVTLILVATGFPLFKQIEKLVH